MIKHTNYTLNQQKRGGGGGDGLRGWECCRQRKTINKEEKVIGEEKG